MATAPSWAQKPRAASPLEIGADPVAAAPLSSADGQANLVAGRAVALFRQDAVVRPAAPEAMAREFLSGHEGLLGLRASDMEVVKVREGRAGTTIRFRQTVNGVPVWGTETAVSIDKLNRVQTVFNGARDVRLPSTAPALASGDARDAAYAHLGIAGTIHFEETNLVVWPGASGSRLAWQVRVEAAEPRGDWEAIVDAQTGELLRVADRLLTHHGEDVEPPLAIPTVETHPLYRHVVEATGLIFDPNPLTRTGSVYGGGYVDGPERETSTRRSSRLPGRSFLSATSRSTAAQYTLEGPWASILDWDAPSKGTFPQSTADWSFTRDNDAFEAATAYWHIDNYMRYINETLGIPALPQAYTGGVRFDPSGWNGADNSSFSSGSDRLTFGEGCVDDAEDADVILHELGHGLHDWLAQISQNDGLSEGLGDYVAASYSRGLGLISPSDAAYNWIFKWDGHNACWGGRSSNVTSTYPVGSLPHARGQHWSTSLMRVWDVLGREKTDAAVYEGIAMTNGTTTQPEAAQAVMQAAANMGYSDEELEVFLNSFQQQGYTGLFLPVANEPTSPEPLASGAALTAPRPNPFLGTTEVELTVDKPQHVTVEVYDALGRRVSTLLNEEVLAGRRYPITLDGTGLDAGIYVLRARGETFETAQRVTLTR